VCRQSSNRCPARAASLPFVAGSEGCGQSAPGDSQPHVFYHQHNRNHRSRRDHDNDERYGPIRLKKRFDSDDIDVLSFGNRRVASNAAARHPSFRTGPASPVAVDTDGPDRAI
jgi:hypothetical protein